MQKNFNPLLFLAMLLLSSLTVEANPIDSLQAATVATNHFKLHADQFSGIEFAYKKQAEGTNEVLYYVFNHKNDKGFVIVVADDASIPILGYSLESKFSTENQPPAFTAMLGTRAQEINYIKEKQLIATESIKSQWKNLMTLNPNTVEVEKRVAVAPLLTTTWNQNPYYNDKCPIDPLTYPNANGRVVTGCVATAMAQIMKYYNHPKVGTGLHSYTPRTHPEYGVQSANFGMTTYDWTNMPNSVISANSAVSTLMYHCGVSVDMNYGNKNDGGSGASTALMANSLKTYFSYDPGITEISRKNYSDAEWIGKLKAELDAKRPMEYSGRTPDNASGHAFICDGYNDAQGVDFFHFNWGWGGSANGNFSINGLNPNGLSFNASQQAVIGIKPASTPSSFYSLQLSKAIIVTPNLVITGNTVNLNLGLINEGNAQFTGNVFVGLFSNITNSGRYIGGIKTNQQLAAGASINLNFTEVITEAAGEYSIYAFYDNGTGRKDITNSYTKITVVTQPPTNVLPTVSITSPTMGSSFDTPATVTVNATAADSDGTISKVEFYNGATLLNTDNAAPYSYIWAGMPAGTYTLTAKAYDNVNAVTTSTAVTITVKTNMLPTVSITSPTMGSSFATPASVTINSTAADSDGTISKVEFYNGATLLNTDNTAPYSYIWAGMPAGTYSLTAKAYDNLNAVTTSTAVTITVTVKVNVAPAISITSPANGTNFTNPASVTINATATDSDGTISKVEFYNGATLLGTTTTAPYMYAWSGIAAGTYTLTAKAYDNVNAVTSSTAVTITVKTNMLPTVSITSPTMGSSFATPATVTVNATAADSDGTISKVEFYNGATLLNTDNAAPYSYIWAGMPAGTYTLTAKAYDNLNAVTTSTAVTITVKANVAPVVSITSPTTGSSFATPASVTINATATDSDGTISKVEFYNGVTLLNTDNAAPYSYIWAGMPAGTYTLTAKAYDNLNMVTTSTAVTITVKAIVYTMTITSPKAGDRFTGNTNMPITWISNVTGNVKIEILKAGAVVTSSILGNTGSANWIVPNVDANDYAVRISSVDMPNITATSGFSTVKAVVYTMTITSPKTGDRFIVGTAMPIMWTTNTTGNVKLELLKAGALAGVIEASTPNNGRFDLLIPNTVADGNDYAIRVSSVSMPSVTAISGIFSIAKPVANLQFKLPLVINPTTIVSGKPITISFGVINLSNTTFQGNIALSIFDKNGNHLQFINNSLVQLLLNSTFSYGNSLVLNYAPGEYVIGVAAFTTATQSWSNIGSGIKITIVKPATLDVTPISTIDNNNEKDKIVTLRNLTTTQNEAFAAEIQTYPNPTKDLFTIEIPTNAAVQQILLMDATGKTLQSIKEPSNQFTMDVSRYQAGVYLLHITSDKGIVTKKISVIK